MKIFDKKNIYEYFFGTINPKNLIHANLCEPDGQMIYVFANDNYTYLYTCSNY